MSLLFLGRSQNFINNNFKYQDNKILRKPYDLKKI